MTEVGNVQGFSIDPDSWTEPSQLFPGQVLVSEYRWCSDKYLDGVVDRIVAQADPKLGLTREAVLQRLADSNPSKEARIPQWDLRVKRLDVILQLPDGSQVDAVRYGGFDLVKWNRTENTFVAINPNYQKETFISSAWKRIAGTVQPPEVLVGKLFDFEFFPTKRFGGAMPAKRVLVPLRLLAPDYQYTGEVQITQVPDREDSNTNEAATATAPTAQEGISEADAIERLVMEILPGQNINNMGAVVALLPPEVRSHQSIINGVATGELVKNLAASGRINIAADGAITA